MEVRAPFLRTLATEARRLHDQSTRKPAGAPDGRVKRLAAAVPTASRSAGPSSCRNSIRAGDRRGVDAPASRCFGRPVRLAPSVASKADATLGCYSNSAFFFAVDPQVSSLSHSRKESLCGATRTQSVQEGAATRVHWQA